MSDEIKLPIKPIGKQMQEIINTLNGKSDKYNNMRIGAAHDTLIMLTKILQQDFIGALDIYNVLDWTSDCQLDYRIIDFLSICQDIVNEQQNKKE